MKWEDYKNNEVRQFDPKYEKTDIECPKCGCYIYKDISFQYCTNPPRHQFYCLTCGWEGIK